MINYAYLALNCALAVEYWPLTYGKIISDIPRSLEIQAKRCGLTTSRKAYIGWEYI